MSSICPTIPVSTHNEYNRLLKAYQDAKRAYPLDDSKENWDRMRDATLRLKKYNDKRDGYGFSIW